MARRLRGTLPVLVAALLMQTGCVATSLWEDASPAAIANDQAVKAGTALPLKESTQLHLNLADKFQKSGNFGEAAAQLEMVRAENPGVKNVDRRLAVLYNELGQLQKALAEYQKLLAASPKDADLLDDVGRCYFDMHNWPQAEDYFRQAVAINPQHRRAWVNLGETLGQQERYADSREAFLKAVTPAEAECNVGFIYLTQGKRAEGREAYQHALDLDPASEMARAVLQRLDKGGDLSDVLPTERPVGEKPLPLPPETPAEPAPSQPEQ